MRKGEQTRQEIIRKAATIFNQRGYDGAALSDLMRATGLVKGGIYRHFSSKQELAGEALDHAWKLAMDTRFGGTEGIPDSVDQLKQLAGGPPAAEHRHRFRRWQSPAAGQGSAGLEFVA